MSRSKGFDSNSSFINFSTKWPHSEKSSECKNAYFPLSFFLGMKLLLIKVVVFGT